MTVTVFFTDLRDTASKLERYVLDWQDGLTAFQALEHALGAAVVVKIDSDLKADSKELIVSWMNRHTEEASEIGGVGRLDWDITDDTVLTVSYEGKETTQEQIDELLEWTLRQAL